MPAGQVWSPAPTGTGRVDGISVAAVAPTTFLRKQLTISGGRVAAPAGGGDAICLSLSGASLTSEAAGSHFLRTAVVSRAQPAFFPPPGIEGPRRVSGPRRRISLFWRGCCFLDRFKGSVPPPSLLS